MRFSAWIGHADGGVLVYSRWSIAFKESTTVQKKATPRRPWLTSTPIMLLLFGALLGGYWFYSREPASIPLGYGELKLILQDRNAAVRFRNVKVGRSEVRGEIVTNDEVSEGDLAAVRQTQVKSF